MWSAIKRLALGVFLIVLASAVLLVWDWGRRQAGREVVRRVAILQHSSQPALDSGVEGMIAGLAQTGLVDGKNISIRRFNAENDMPTANAIAKQITNGEYALVLSASTLSMQALANANRAGKTIHVFGLVSDPFEAGVGISRDNPLQHPRHLVGYGTMQPVAEAFELARRLFPALHTVGTVWNPSESNSEAQLTVARATCGRLGIQLQEATVDATTGVMQAASSLVGRDVQAVWVPGDVTVLTAMDAVVLAARQAGVPVFTSIPGNAVRGTLFDLGADYFEVGRLAGELAGQILRGADPAKIAVKNVMPQTLLVNRAALEGLKDHWQLPGDVLRTAHFVGDAQPAAPVKAATTMVRPAPGAVFKVGIVYFAPESGVEDCMQGLLDGFRDLGFVEGQNLEVHKAHAQGEIANIPQLLQNYDGQGLDLIIPMTTPCLTAACGTVKKTPVVFTYVYDPIAAGAGTSFTQHLPNVTGVGSFPPVADTVALMQKLMPGVTTIGTLYNSSEANSRKVVEVARHEVAQRGLRLEEVTVTNASDVFQAAQALTARGIQVLWIAGDNTAIQGFDAVVKVANDARVPLITNDVEPVATHSLATVGIGFYASGYAAAKLGARVLLGAKPQDLAIENVAATKVAVNLLVAHRLGLNVPNEALRRADVLIDETGTHAQSAADAQAPPNRAPMAPLPRKWKVDILEYVNVLDVEDAEKGMRAGLRDSGLAEGRDYEVRVRSAQGDMPTLSTMVDTALSDGTNLIMTLSTPTLQAALRRAQDVPVVFTFVADAVAAGAGRSAEDHLPNVTGVPTPAAYEELVDIVRQCLPTAQRIGTLFVPAEVNSVYNKEQLETAARRRGLELLAVAANTTAEVSDAALSLLAQNVAAVCQAAGNLTTAGFASIAQPARRAGVPVFGFLSSDVQNGAVVVAARDYFDGGREAGLIAGRIMRGENPATIPFHPMQTTKILVNLEAARASGLTIPPAVLSRAALVIGQ